MKHQLLSILFNELRKIKINWLTSPFFSTENKLLQMKIAKEFGLLIPDSYVITSKSDLIEIIKLHNGKDLITKPFENCRHLKVNGESIQMRTKVVNEHIDNIPDFFRQH